MKELLTKIESYLRPSLESLSVSDKIAVGMSGGVDSAVTLYLLKELGLNVFGVFMKNWNEQDNNGVCLSEYDYKDVIDVCEQLQTPYYSIDLSKEYWERVFQKFILDIKNGLTPNPDVLCNREIKFDAFWLSLKKMGATKIATGHYAKIVKEEGNFFLKKAIDHTKDQTYFLTQMPREMLAQTIFPLGVLKKVEVRKIANFLKLKVKDKKDSTGICFIGERNFKEFVSKYVESVQGNFIDINSDKVLGLHDGSCFYTVGQRKGLGIGGPGGPWFVVSKDNNKNIVYVTNNEFDSKLYARSCIASDVKWLVDWPKGCTKYQIQCRVRYRQKELPAEMSLLENNQVSTIFLERQRAVTEGQYIVFYQEDKCLGGAEIQKVVVE